MKKIKSLADRVEDIEVKIWDLQAELMNSGFFHSKNKVIKALSNAGLSLYRYRHDEEVA